MLIGTVVSLSKIPSSETMTPVSVAAPLRFIMAPASSFTTVLWSIISPVTDLEEQ